MYAMSESSYITVLLQAIGQRYADLRIIQPQAEKAMQRSIADIESAMVMRSLHREDHLSQVQIAVLLNRHKSFVCRRLKLVEKLSDEVLEHLNPNPTIQANAAVSTVFSLKSSVNHLSPQQKICEYRLGKFRQSLK